jgi:hypothetical protein
MRRRANADLSFAENSMPLRIVNQRLYPGLKDLFEE